MPLNSRTPLWTMPRTLPVEVTTRVWTDEDTGVGPDSVVKAIEGGGAITCARVNPHSNTSKGFALRFRVQVLDRRWIVARRFDWLLPRLSPTISSFAIGFLLFSRPTHSSL